MTLDPEQLRRAMRAWTTGVAILTASHSGETHGMTINSFNSLSLDPPMVCVTVRNETRIHHLIEHAQTFGVTVLAASQRALAEDFAGRKHGPDRMSEVNLQTLASGAPALTSGLASFDCRVTQTLRLGKNTMFLAEVVSAQIHSTENPLVYHNRTYHQLK
ncbi:MAG: p-hydroxyphenylacetate 3-hydroxylase, reductase component [Anaerolineales bacterium]|nr:p-hydroxyphenylacetate 3-hydroxylase, reductase component [Anaerolineales bacterium]